MWRIIEIEAKLKLRLITCEFEILSYLYFNGPTRSHDLSAHTRSSDANFQVILRRLRENNIVEQHIDPVDRRARIYDLTRPVRESFAAMFDSDPDSRAILLAIAQHSKSIAAREDEHS